MARIALLIFLALLVVGCASRSYVPESPQLNSCLQQYKQANAEIQQRKIPEVGAPLVDGFPFLRTSRFLASFADQAVEDDARYMAWLQMLNAQAVSVVTQWLSETDEQELQRCGQQLVENLARNELMRSILQIRSQVPPSYNLWQRVLGLYPLATIPFRQGVVREQRAHQQKSARYISQLPEGVYSYFGQEAGASGGLEVFPLLQNMLGVPQISQAQEDSLLSRFSPVFALPESRYGLAEYDKPGVPSNSGFNSSRPVIYAWLDFGRFRGGVTIRLNYSVWFSERPKERTFDLLGGELDGLIWRVHLSSSGQVLAWDSIHNCGCWYKIFPAKDRTVHQADRFFREPVYIGQKLTDQQVRKVLYLQSGTHHIEAIREQTEELEVKLAAMTSLHELIKEQPPLFNRQGLIDRSRRLERWFFWPMGIPSAGAMRAPGTHAIAFVGRRYFDEPLLLEEIGLQ